MPGVLLKADDGNVYATRQPRAGEFLYGGPGNPEWRTLIASVVPYMTEKSGGAGNVSNALDLLMSSVKDISPRLSRVEINISQVAIDNQRAIGAMHAQVAELAKHVNDTAEAIKSVSHESLSVSRISNPALKLEVGRQDLTLDLTVKNSYNDMRSNCGANSIQGAIEVALSQAKQALDKIYILEQQLTELRAETQRLAQAA